MRSVIALASSRAEASFVSRSGSAAPANEAESTATPATRPAAIPSLSWVRTASAPSVACGVSWRARAEGVALRGDACDSPLAAHLMGRLWVPRSRLSAPGFGSYQRAGTLADACRLAAGGDGPSRTGPRLQGIVHGVARGRPGLLLGLVLAGGDVGDGRQRGETPA